MKKDKKSFIMYCEWIATFSQLDDETAGKLIKHIFEYVNDNEPISENFVVNLAFTPIKQSLKRDLKKYIGIKEDRKRAGRIGNLKRHHSDIYGMFSKGKLELEEAEKLVESRKRRTCEFCDDNCRTCEFCDRKSSQTVANVAVNVNDNVNVNVNDNVIIEKETKRKVERPAAVVASEIEKKIIPQNGVLKNDDLKDLLKSEKYGEWRNLICKQNEISITLLPELIDKFFGHAGESGTLEQTTKEAQIWFRNWIKKIPKEKTINVEDPAQAPDDSGNWIFRNKKWINKENLTQAQKRRLGI